MSIKAAATTDTCSLTASLPNKYPITVMFWLYVPSTMGTLSPALVELSSGADALWDVAMRNNTTYWQLDLYSSGGGDVYGSATGITTNAWHSIAVTISAGGSINSYIDTVADIVAASASSSETATTLQVGHSVDGNNAPFSTSGASFYGLKIWNAELSGAEITTEDGSYAPVRTTNLYDGWLLASVATAGTASNNGHTFTTVTGWTNDSDPAAKGPPPPTPLVNLRYQSVA